MLVSSKAPVNPAPDALEVLFRAGSVSLIAFEIVAVSPLLKASKILNFRTDCSIETALSCAGIVLVEGFAEWKLEVDRINPAVPVEGLEW